MLRRIEQLHESERARFGSTLIEHGPAFFMDGALIVEALATRAAFESKMVRKLDVYCRDRNAIENTAGYTFSFAFTHPFDFASEVKDRARRCPKSSRSAPTLSSSRFIYDSEGDRNSPIASWGGWIQSATKSKTRAALDCLIQNVPYRNI